MLCVTQRVRVAIGSGSSIGRVIGTCGKGAGGVPCWRDLMRGLDGCRDQPCSGSDSLLSAKMAGTQLPVMLLTLSPRAPNGHAPPRVPLLLLRLSPRTPLSVNNASSPPTGLPGLVLPVSVPSHDFSLGRSLSVPTRRVPNDEFYPRLRRHQTPLIGPFLDDRLPVSLRGPA